ncbi:uncharacterized protein EDB93DRAFT_50555 [Suillus bovinus]|uniref:uncharacterized protein n=1 Tax=Suillus bovinus TaxID=48563 RepID=UPI001B876720|nr:uncharacterized protein EDB93DRAFT_50555 [Suillus bovinus]KAG2160258.1 hypothetical protein EDB93DRAFT_50555 [Suillus bovinus]
MSLLQGVLKSQSQTYDLNGLYPSSRQSQPEDDSDDELVGVFSLPGTPARSRGPSRPSSRPVSPTRWGLTRSASALPSKGLSSDPLKAFPTQVSQNIFQWLGISELANCARVSRKWNKSQTLNYSNSYIHHLACCMLTICTVLQVWFQHYRKENFHDETLPPGKWTRRESKQNWVDSLSSCIWLHDLMICSQRITYIKFVSNRSPPSSPLPSRGSGRTSPSQSGYQTPKELREEQWRQKELTQSRPGKLEMREMYKELGGRKSRTKGKLGSSGGHRDRTGWGEGDDD